MRDPMTAPDILQLIERGTEDDSDMIPLAAAEIKRLRAWKCEAIAVLDQWDSIYDRVPHPSTQLGWTKASSVAAALDGLEQSLDLLAAWIDGGHHWSADGLSDMITFRLWVRRLAALSDV